MKIYTATIDHKFGTNTHVSLTEEGIRKDVAEYCREWWTDFDGLADVDIPEDDQETIDLYFNEENAGVYESLTYGETALDLPGTPFKQLTEEEARDKTEMIYVEMESGFHIAVDHTYMDQVEEFKLLLPTGEVLDSETLK